MLRQKHSKENHQIGYIKHNVLRESLTLNTITITFLKPLVETYISLDYDSKHEAHIPSFNCLINVDTVRY